MLKTQEERQGAVLCPDDRRGGESPAPSAFQTQVNGSLIVCATILCDIEKIMFVTNGGHYVV